MPEPKKAISSAQKAKQREEEMRRYLAAHDYREATHKDTYTFLCNNPEALKLYPALTSPISSGPQTFVATAKKVYQKMQAEAAEKALHKPTAQAGQRPSLAA